MSLKVFFKEYVTHIFAPIQVFSMLLAICILGIAGPFGTYDKMTIIQCTIYWGLVVVLAVLIVTAVKLVAAEMFPKLGFWRIQMLISATFAAIFTPVLLICAPIITSGMHQHFMPVWMLFLIVFAVAMAVAQIRVLSKQRTVSGRVRLFERFADKSVKQIYRVSVRDHHVDVFTDRGTETLLMRFSDAIAELDGIQGNQVHRSHWVARNAMVRLDRSGGKSFLVLKDGSRVPVSRSYLAKVESRLTNGPASESSTVFAR